MSIFQIKQINFILIVKKVKFELNFLNKAYLIKFYIKQILEKAEKIRMRVRHTD